MVKRDDLFNNSNTLNVNNDVLKVQSIQNGAFAKIYGFTSSLSFQFLKYFKIKSNVSFNKGIEVLDNGSEAPLRHAAPLFGNFLVSFNKNKWNANCIYEYNGSIKSKDLAPSEIEKSYLYALDSNGLPYVPSWGTLHLKTSYECFKNTTIYLGLENIFDKLDNSC